MKVLFITRKSDRCGVADYGKRVFNILCKSDILDMTLAEVSNEYDIASFYLNKPDVILYNYHPATLPFITDSGLNKSIPHIAIIHEGGLGFTPNVIIDSDSTAKEGNGYFSSPRPLFEDIFIEAHKNALPIIGSFGFGFPDKNFSTIAKCVLDQFDTAVLRLNIPFAEFGDNEGYLARKEVEKVQEVLQGSNILLEINHDFLTQHELLKWLRQNDLNVFMYNHSHGRGLSSTIDYALSVRKPIAISDSFMFRHLPRSLINDNFKEVINNGIDPLLGVYEQHTNKNLLNKYEYICQLQ